MEVRKLNDKLPVPRKLLSDIGVYKGDYVTIELDNDKIVIKKCNLPIEEAERLYELSITNTAFSKKIDKKEEIKVNPIKTDSKNKVEISKPIIKKEETYELKTTARNEITIPAKLFKELDLSEKEYCSEVLSDKEQYTIKITPGEGDLKFRKSNVLSLNELGKKFNFKTKPGIFVIFTRTDDILHIIIDSKSIRTTDPTIELNKQSKSLDIKNTPIDVITEQIDTENKHNSSNSVIKQSFEMKGGINKDKPSSKPPVPTPAPAPSLKSVSDDIGEQIITKRKPLTIVPNRNSKRNKQEKNSIRIKLEEQYQQLVSKNKNNNSIIKFISESDLPSNQTRCYICNAKLTNKDNSMLNHNRICNKCKHTQLKRFFKPLYEQAKLRQQLNNLNKSN